jgi:hypothetical protein
MSPLEILNEAEVGVAREKAPTMIGALDPQELAERRIVAPRRLMELEADVELALEKGFVHAPERPEIGAAETQTEFLAQRAHELCVMAFENVTGMRLALDERKEVSER